MAVQYKCPECATALKMAAAPAPGRRVKCPKCGQVFAPVKQLPANSALAKKAAPAAAPVSSAAAARAKANDDEDWNDTNPYDMTVDNSPAAERVTFDQIRDRFPRSKRGPAQKAVVIPANVLIGLGIKQCIFAIALAVWSVWPIIFYDATPTRDVYIGSFIWLGYAALWFTLSALVVNGAFKMHTLESYPWAWVGIVIGMITGLSLFASLWCIFVLKNPDVKAGFYEKKPTL